MYIRIKLQIVYTIACQLMLEMFIATKAVTINPRKMTVIIATGGQSANNFFYFIIEICNTFFAL